MLRFQVPSRVQGRLHRSVAALSSGAVIAVAILVSATAVQAQSFTWGGVGSTTATTGYNIGTNWANPPAGAPPVAAGQSAIFDTTGTTSVVVSFAAPDSWTFKATSQSYAISGGNVNFSLAGASGGIINNANSSQTISISNDIGETVAGVQVQQIGNSTLVLSGTNTYSGGTKISAGTLQLGTLATTASIIGAVSNGGFFSIVNANTAGITSITNDGGLTAFSNATSASTITITNKNGGETDFGIALGTDTATAGSATITNSSGGLTVFNAFTTAGSATITNMFVGETNFFDHSNAGSATIINRYGGLTLFNNLSTAGNANITNRFGGSTLFAGNSSAGNATITNNSFGGIFGPPSGWVSSKRARLAPRPSSIIIMDLSLSAFRSVLTLLPRITRRLQTIPAVDWSSMRLRRPATLPSPPTAAAQSSSSTPAPAATRSSSPTEPATSISPAASVLDLTAG